MPLQVTFNAAARCLQQQPIEEIKALRGAAAVAKTAVNIGSGGSASAVDLKVPAGVATMSESVVVFDLPATAGTFGVTVGAPGTGPAPAGTPVGTSKGEHYYLYFSVCGTTHIYTGNMSIFTVYSETWRFVRPDTDTPSVHTSF